MIKLVRYASNPIISPRDNFWEVNGTFNPAAIKIGSKIYIIYRQISKNNISTFGLAISSNGYDIDERLEYPIYIPREYFEIHPSVYPIFLKEKTKYFYLLNKKLKIKEQYISGYYYFRFINKEDLEIKSYDLFENVKPLSYFGVEDPRITRIGNKIYLTYVAFNGIEPPRIAMSWIKVKDFVEGNFENWSKPILVSHPEIVDKSGVLFPEKINGKYVFFHRIFPMIWKDQVKDIKEFYNGKFLFGEPFIYPRYSFWDSRKIAPGSSPIKFKNKWILIYIGVSGWDPYYKLLNLSPSKFKVNDGYVYKAGLMIFDKNLNPIYRSEQPILVPEAWYEKYQYAKPNVVYATGSVIKNKELLVYYGASDFFVSVGSLDLNIIKEIINNNDTKEIYRESYSLSKSKKLLGSRCRFKSLSYKIWKKSCNAIQGYFCTLTKRCWKLH